MNKYLESRQDKGDRLRRLLPYAVIAAVLLASYVVIFQLDFIMLEPAQAQVNLPEVGEAVTETVTGAAAERNAELAEMERELDNQPVGEPEEDEIPGIIPEDQMPPGESVEPASPGEQLTLPDGDQIYLTSTVGLGGIKLTDMDPDELRAALFELKETQGNAAIVNDVMPIMLRFQNMVNTDTEEWIPVSDSDYPPWESGEKRYSPFDSISGGGGAPPMSTHNVPPFPQVVRDIPDEGDHPECQAENIARGLSLRGVIGSPGNYRAILSGFGLENEFGVGDTITNQCGYNFIIQEISMSAVRIVNESMPNEYGLVQFATREGIGDFSISY